LIQSKLIASPSTFDIPCSIFYICFLSALLTQRYLQTDMLGIHQTMFAMLDIGMLAVRILAVAGAVAVGGLGTGWLVKVLAKTVAFKNLPTPLLRVSRVLGGLVVGLIVAAWVFNLGGTGGIGGSGGGWWPFGQAGGSGTSNAPGQDGVSVPAHPRPLPDAKARRIQRLGGRDAEQNQRFYQIEGEQSRTWPELEKILAERKKNDPSLVIEIVLAKGSVAEQSEPVQQLKNWAKKNSVAVK